MPRTREVAQRRRTRGEGTIYEKTRTWKTSDGKTRSKKIWVAEVSEGFITKGGLSKRQRRRFTANTAAEARVKRDRYLQQKGEPIPEAPEVDPATVSEFIPRFLAHWSTHPRRDGKSRSPATLHSYEKTLRLHVQPYLGKVQLAELSPARLKTFYTSLEPCVSPSMRARVHAALRAMLNHARYEGIVVRPLFDSIRPAIPRYKRPPVEPLNEKQIAALLKAAKGHRIAEALIPLALDSGMREGELIGLRWEDVDIRGRKIHVRKAASEVAGEISMEAPKSGSGRSIPVSEATIAALKRRKAIAGREGLADCELVFPAERGGPLYKSNFLRETWGPLREAAGIRKARFHDLRHTCATMLLKANLHPKVVQERLGHSSIVLTMDTYSAFLPSMQAGAALAMGRALNRLSRAKGRAS
ncbi:MAG: tyrosine-type recombinase/integrase [Candidatus Cybelea sp.]